MSELQIHLTLEERNALQEPVCPGCGAQVDERFDCCEVHRSTRAHAALLDHLNRQFSKPDEQKSRDGYGVQDRSKL